MVIAGIRRESLALDSHTSPGTKAPDIGTNDVDRLFREHNAALLRFVLTNHPRAAITMDGGTTFHFVAEGIHAALSRATEAADGRDVRVGGGAATIQQYLRAGLVDEMPLAIAPTLLGSGEHLFERALGLMRAS